MAGKRAGSRRGPRTRRGFDAGLLWLSLGVTVLVVAWGYLVLAAIDFGASARGGQAAAWWFLLLASLGAVACLFAGLMLVARILRRLGITAPPGSGGSAGGSGHAGSHEIGAEPSHPQPGHPQPGHAGSNGTEHRIGTGEGLDVVEGGRRGDTPPRAPGGRRIKT